jgi:hypothetical protein
MAADDLAWNQDGIRNMVAFSRSLGAAHSAPSLVEDALALWASLTPDEQLQMVLAMAVFIDGAATAVARQGGDMWGDILARAEGLPG